MPKKKSAFTVFLIIHSFADFGKPPVSFIVVPLAAWGFEKSFDLRPTEENIGYWVDFTRMKTREIKHAIDEARELSQTYASIERMLREMYPDAVAALDEEDRQIAEEANGDSVKESGNGGGQEE